MALRWSLQQNPLLRLQSLLLVQSSPENIKNHWPLKLDYPIFPFFQFEPTEKFVLKELKSQNPITNSCTKVFDLKFHIILLQTKWGPWVNEGLSQEGFNIFLDSLFITMKVKIEMWIWVAKWLKAIDLPS